MSQKQTLDTSETLHGNTIISTEEKVANISKDITGKTAEYSQIVYEYIKHIYNEGFINFILSPYSKIWFLILISSIFYNIFFQPIILTGMGLSYVKKDGSTPKRFLKTVNGGVIFSLLILCLMYTYPDEIDVLNIVGDIKGSTSEAFTTIPYKNDCPIHSPRHFSNPSTKISQNKKRIEIY